MRTPIDINVSKEKDIAWITSKTDKGKWTDPMRTTKDKSSDRQRWTEFEIP